MPLTSFRNTILAPTIVAATLFIQSTAAHAVAMYDGMSAAMLTITEITGDVSVTMTYGAESTPMTGVIDVLMMTGGGVATGSGSVDLIPMPPGPPAMTDPVPAMVGSTIDNLAMISGSATAPGDSAFSDILTTGIFSGEAGMLGGSFTVALSYSMSVMASIGGADEMAGALAAVGIKDLKGMSVFFDGVSTPMGGGMDMASDMMMFTILVAPDDINGFILGADTMGFATVVPEPTSLVLLGLGLIALGVSRKRRV